MRFGPNGKAGADSCARLVEGVDAIQDTRADATVDLVIGNGFKALVAPPPTATSAAPNPC